MRGKEFVNFRSKKITHCPYQIPSHYRILVQDAIPEPEIAVMVSRLDLGRFYNEIAKLLKML